MNLSDRAYFYNTFFNKEFSNINNYKKTPYLRNNLFNIYEKIFLDMCEANKNIERNKKKIEYIVRDNNNFMKCNMLMNNPFIENHIKTDINTK